MLGSMRYYIWLPARLISNPSLPPDHSPDQEIEYSDLEEYDVSVQGLHFCFSGFFLENNTKEKKFFDNLQLLWENCI